ncbi:MAG: GAF domain-containing protein [Rhizobiaceae bacterium]|nr:GAF domain-containing protein [Rhizobiaceae bacterium]
MTGPVLDTIRDCFEGVVPALLATCDRNGVPNVSLISQVHYVDPGRVALTYQFFNKTRQNLTTTRIAAVSVFNPADLIDYRLVLEYEETQSAGPIFESMKAKLAGLASHSGMQDVFRLQGADICRVRSITAMPGVAEPQPQVRNLLSGVRTTFGDLAKGSELGELCDCALACLRDYFGVGHAMVLMLDAAAGRLFTIASIGYAMSGVGSELALGAGVVGVAARESVPIRIGHMTSEYSYRSTIRAQARHRGLDSPPATEIPYPGLPAPESQIALPLVADGRVLGVLFAESAEPMRFRYDDEDALALVAGRLAELILASQPDEPSSTQHQPDRLAVAATGQRVVVRHYQVDDSIFLDHDYLIRGVAGAIFWKLACEYVRNGRGEFSNRELRLDPALRLPEYAENLEARLVLLQRRLCERSTIRMERCGRGRFRFVVPGTLVLDEVAAGGAR